jgi:serine/threonine protein kinase
MTREDSLLDPVAPLAEEFAARVRRGEQPSVTEYVARHPDLADRLRQVLPMMVLMDEAASADRTGTHTGRDADLPDLIGGYRILREVGRGGMGVVYEAEQESLGRRVALKVLAAAAIPEPKQLLRFHREAKAAARLHHTNIVPVFGVGEGEGVHYYVMQFIQGLGLDAVLDEV